MRSEDYSIFAANNSLSMRTIVNMAACFPRALRVRRLKYSISKKNKQAKTQKATKN
jgi:hypothetical protein